METQICTKCKIDKPLEEFHKHIRRKNGYRGICKKCRSHPKPPIIIDNHKVCPKCKKKKHVSEYYNDSNTGIGISTRCKVCVNKHVLDHRKNHPEVRKRYKKLNEEKIKLYTKNYYHANREKALENNKNYIRDKDKKKLSDQKYQRENKVKLRPRKAAYHANRRKTDLNYKIKCNLRTRIYHALQAKEKNQKKYHSTVELIGMEIKEFILYIENLFHPSMSWDNYGEWQIDHIKPCKLFDLTDPVQQKKCFHYSNMQPLWAIDNLSKGSKY